MKHAFDLFEHIGDGDDKQILECECMGSFGNSARLDSGLFLGLEMDWQIAGGRAWNWICQV